MGMKRRAFITLLGAATAWPLVARAQQSAQIRRVAVLLAEAVEDDPEYERRISTFAEALRDLGWIDDQNLKLSVHRVRPSAADIRKGVAELLAENPDIIVSGGGTTTPPVLQATSRIPVVFATAIDPVGSGFVESLAHPGGNATGFMQFEYSLSGKWLELLKQVSPGVTRAAVLRDPTVTAGIGQFAVIQAVAPSVGVEVSPIDTNNAAEIERAVSDFAREPNGGLIATASASGITQRELI